MISLSHGAGTLVPMAGTSNTLGSQVWKISVMNMFCMFDVATLRTEHAVLRATGLNELVVCFVKSLPSNCRGIYLA